MKKNSDKKIVIDQTGHGTPVTRRDFLGRGLITGVGTAMMPSLLGMLASKVAYGAPASCGGGSGASDMGVLVIDGAGGFNIPGSNVMAGGPGGQLDPLSVNGYQTLGISAADAAAIVGGGGVVPLFGASPNESVLCFHSKSALFEGIKSGTNGTTALLRTNGFLIAGASGDDSDQNQIGMAHLLARAGVSGKITSIVGTSERPSGGRHVDAFARAETLPARVQSGADAVALGTFGALETNISRLNAEKVLQRVSKFNSSELDRINRRDLPQIMADFVKCGYLKAVDLIQQDPGGLNPANNTAITQAGFANGIGNNGDENRTAALANLVLKGHAGVAVQEVGGCDYHGDNVGRQNQDTKDFQIGRMIGLAINLASRENKKLAVVVTTDGGVSASTNPATTNVTVGGVAFGPKPNFTSDNGSRSSVLMLVYDPVGPVTVNNTQIGWFSVGDGGVQNSATDISNNSANVVQTVVYNYLYFLGKESMFSSIVDRPFASEGTLQGSYLGLGRKA